MKFQAGNGLDILSEYVPSQKLVKNHFFNTLIIERVEKVVFIDRSFYILAL